MKLSLLKKVQIGIFIAFLAPTTVGFLALYNFYNSTVNYVAGGSTTTMILDEAANIQKNFGVLIQDWKNTLLRGKNPKQFEKYSKAFDERIDIIYSESEVLSGHLPESKKHHVETFIERFKNLENKYKEARSNHLLNSFNPDDADEAVKGLDRNVLDSITALAAELTTEDKAEETKMLEKSKKLMFTSTFVSVGLGLVVFLIVSVLFSRIIKSLLSVAHNVDQISSQLTQTSNLVSGSSQQLSQSSAEQASSLEETAASTQEITAMVQKNSENSKVVLEASVKSKSNADQGKVVIDSMIVSMEDINLSNQSILKQVEENNIKMNEIVSVIKSVGEKTKVINDIVFQTKLLSFNASVEAARAGEQGKGFAVVAEEVGSLAQMSGNAAEEISNLLETSIKRVDEIATQTKANIESMIKRGTEKVEEGNKVAHDCGSVFNEILNDINSIAQMTKDISTATDEQYKGVQEISKAMEMLDKSTQQNAVVSQEVAKSAVDLSSQATSLKDSVVQMMGTISGQQS